MKKKIIPFKSEGLFFHKEYLGHKRNTVKKVEVTDKRYNILWEIIQRKKPDCKYYIEICESTDITISFKRRITDVSYWNGLYIISW